MNGPMYFGGERKKEKLPKPKNIKGVPKYIWLAIKKAFKTVRGFFSRLFYIFGLVWETRPWILFVMLGLAIVEGVMPVIKAVSTDRGSRAAAPTPGRASNTR